MTFDETTTSTFIILVIIFAIILAAITISILIINQLHTKPRVDLEQRRVVDNTAVKLESGQIKQPDFYHSQPNICHKNYNRRSAESFSYFPARQFHHQISQNHLNLIKEIQLANQRSNSTFVYYV